MALLGCATTNNEFQVIAHRGASGYLPENTLASKALAYGMGVDYIEQDAVITRDDKAVVFHDLFWSVLLMSGKFLKIELKMMVIITYWTLLWRRFKP